MPTPIPCFVSGKACVLATFCLLASIALPSALSAAPKKTLVTFDPSVWVDASKHAVQVGQIAVFVQKVSVGAVELNDLGRARASGKVLLIEMGIGNLTETKKLDYVGWFALDAFRRSLHPPTVSDNFDNVYASLDYGIFIDVVGQVKTASIHPGKILSDNLIFEVPIDKIKHLRISLPTKGLGLDTKPIQFEIPDSMITWPGREIEPPPKEPVLTLDELTSKAKSLIGKRVTLQGTATMAPVGKTLVFIDFANRGVHLASALAPKASLDLPKRFTFRKDWRYTLRLRANVQRIGADDVIYLDDVNIVSQLWLGR